MSTMALTNCRFWLGGYELSGTQNQMGIDYGAEMKDDTVFGTAGTRSNKPGLQTVKMSGAGFWDSDYDEAIFNRIAAAREVCTITPEGQTEGDRSFFTRGVSGAYNPLSGEIGEIVSYEIDAQSANTPLVRGVVGGLGAKVATGNSTPVQLGAVLSTQKIYAALHVKGPVTGTLPTLDVTVESDALVGFGSPATQLTFTQMTDVGAQWAELAGPITDDWWRVKWTITGTLPSFPLFVSIGIR